MRMAAIDSGGSSFDLGLEEGWEDTMRLVNAAAQSCSLQLA